MLKKDENNFIIRVKRRRTEEPIDKIYVKGHDLKKRKIIKMMRELSLNEPNQREVLMFEKISKEEKRELSKKIDTIKSNLRTPKRNYKLTLDRESNRKNALLRKDEKIKKKRLFHVSERRMFCQDESDFTILDFDTWGCNVFEKKKKKLEDYEYDYYTLTKMVILSREEYNKVVSIYINPSYDDFIEEELKSDDEDEASDNYLKTTYPYDEKMENEKDERMEVKYLMKPIDKPKGVSKSLFKKYQVLKSRLDNRLLVDKHDKNEEFELNNFLNYLQKNEDSKMDINDDEEGFDDGSKMDLTNDYDVDFW